MAKIKLNKKNKFEFFRTKLNSSQKLFLGSTLIVTSIALFISFSSYFVTGFNDQSVLSEFTNKSIQAENLLNKVGALLADFFIHKGFGIIAFIIPGLIFSMWWTFSPCLLADRPNLSFTEAMKKSRLVAKGNWINLILLFIVLGLLQILGAICLGIGLLVTIPVGHVALYFAYAQCKK